MAPGEPRDVGDHPPDESLDHVSTQDLQNEMLNDLISGVNPVERPPPEPTRLTPNKLEFTANNNFPPKEQHNETPDRASYIDGSPSSQIDTGYNNPHKTSEAGIPLADTN